MRRITRLFMSALIVGGMAVPVVANTITVEDPQEGTFAPIDVREARHGHASEEADFQFGGMVLVHKATMYEEWSNDQLESLELRMRSRRWSKPRRLFVARNQDGSLYGIILSGDLLRGYARVDRTDPRTVRISFPKSTLGKDVRRYRWLMLATGPWECSPDVDCAMPPPERVPDRGTILHRGVWRYNE